jgi:predicted RNA-binding protein (virulence factor B family)
MLEIGKYHTLTILRKTPPGLFLGDDDGNEVLLPNKYIPETYEIADELYVFVYLDFDERPVATNIVPKILLNGFAYLEVKDVSDVGAFLDWGLEKDLFLPFREQISHVSIGGYCLVHLYKDKGSERLVATEKVKKFLNNADLNLREGDKVSIIVIDKSDLGMNVIVNQKYAGLIYHNELFQELYPGQTMDAYVRKIRENNKLDISLQAFGYTHIGSDADRILNALKVQNGFLGLHDRSQPEEIYEALGMSKKTFKKAVGLLFKDRKVALEASGIRLL